jgi:hypothetical protein
MIVRRASLAFAFAGFALAAITAVAEPREKTPATQALPEPVAVPVGDSPSGDVDLSGEWRMFLPAGWEQTVTIESLGEDRYYVRPPYVMQGTYAVEEGRLTRLSEERLEGGAESATKLPAREAFAWEIRSPYMLTLAADERSRSNDYAGATLFRGRETEQREAKAEIDEATPKDAEPAPETSDRPFAIDVPETELDVRIFPGQRATRLPSGDLQFAMTVKNDSKETIEFDLPRNPGEESSVLARVRVLESRAADRDELPPLLLHAYAAGPETEKPTVTVRPGQEAKLDIRLDWHEAVKAANRRLPQQRKYEVLLTMTFMAEGKLQHLTGPRGNVVAIDSVKAVR